MSFTSHFYRLIRGHERDLGGRPASPLTRRPSRGRARPAGRRTLALEPLEERNLLAVASWYYDQATALTLDDAGNVYVAGGFRHWADFDPGPGETWLQGQAPTADNARMTPFLARYSPDGSLAWVRTPSATPYADFEDKLATYTDGTGTFVYFAHAYDMLYKYADDGALIWQKASPAFSTPRLMAADASGAVYFAGAFSGTVDFDPSDPSDASDTRTADGSDVFVVKWDADGNFLSVTQLGGPGDQSAAGLAARGSSVVVAGTFRGTLQLPGGNVTDGGVVGTPDGFVIQLDAGGTYQSVATFTDRSLSGVALDAAANAYVLGGGGFVASSTAAGGLRWSGTTGSTPMALTAAGADLYITGGYDGATDFAPSAAFPDNRDVLPGDADTHAFLLRLNAADGTFGWVKGTGGVSRQDVPISSNMGVEVAVDEDPARGGVYAVGRFTSLTPVDFDPSPTATNFLGAPEGEFDAFVWKLSTAGGYKWAFDIGEQTRTVDNGDPGYAELGSGWKDLARSTPAYHGDGRSHAKGTGSNKASWTFSGLTPGQRFEVYATWTADPKNATNTPFSINGVATDPVNQRINPDDYKAPITYHTDNGFHLIFERLTAGATTIFTASAAGTLVIEMTDRANGLVVADAVRIVAAGPSGSPLLAAGGEAPRPGGQTLTDSSLLPIVREAAARWQSTGLTAAQAAALADVNFQIADLGGSTLGLASGKTIWLDDDAAGWGWFIDSTPSDDGEFAAPGDQGEMNRMDLLSAVMHELGHVLGLGHDEDCVMQETLAAGDRLASTAWDAAAHPPSLSQADPLSDHLFAEWADLDLATLAAALDPDRRR